MSQALDHMREMIFNLPFRNAEQVGQLAGGQPGPCQEIDDALSRRPVRR